MYHVHPPLRSPGIPWDRLQFSRDHYRSMRLRSYRNYTNVLPEEASEYRDDILAEARPRAPTRGGRFFDFVRNSRSVQSTIVHFQVGGEGGCRIGYDTILGPGRGRFTEQSNR